MTEVVYRGEDACFLCGAKYSGEKDRRTIVSDERTRVYYVDQRCFARVRDMRRAHGVSPYQGLVMLGERLENLLFGRG